MPSLTDVFEVNFSKLAEAALKSRAPRLMDKGYIGFQVVDKTDDESFAVGMAAFLLNKVWLYVPVFFIENQIKGVEQALIKHRRMQVPLSDKWINTIEEQGRDILGDIFEEVGSEGLRGGGEDFYKGSETINIPEGLEGGVAKGASDDIVPREVVAEMRRRDASSPFGSFNLMDGLRSLGKEASLRFLEWTADDPDFANAVFEHYTEGDLCKLAADTAGGAAENPPKGGAGLTVIDLNADSPEDVAKKAEGLSDTQRRVLNRNGFYVKDTRGPDQVACVFRMSGSGYSNPTSGGAVEIVGRDGAAAAADVFVVEQFTDEQLQECPKRGTTRKIVVVFDDGTWMERTCDSVLVKSVGEVDADKPAYRSATEKALKELAASAGGRRILLFKDGAALVPELELVGGSLLATENGGCRRRVVFGSNGRLGGRLDSVINVPAGARYFPLDDGSADKDFTPMRDASDMIDSALLESSYIPLVLKKPRDGYGVVVDVGDGAATRPRREALMWLTEKMGVRAEEASNMLKSASVGGDMYWIRPAALHKRAAATPADYGTRGTRMRLTTPEEREIRLNADAGLRSAALSAAAAADSAGVREIFDVEVMKALFATGDVSQKQTESVRKWVKAMDGIGRYLLTVYWNYAKFVSNFGKEAMEVFESSARDTFNALGDLILFVRERMSDPSAASGVSVDLDDIDYGDTSDLE